MKKYTFRATIDNGGDGYTYFEVGLNDEQAERLELYGKKPSVYYDFINCEEIKDIYSIAYNKARIVLTEELMENSDLYDDEDEDLDEGYDILDEYFIEVFLPEEFEEDLYEE